MIEVQAKSFMDGNSVAIHLPNALEMQPGVDFVIRKDGDKLTVVPKGQPKRSMAELARRLRELGPPPGPPVGRKKIIFPKRRGL